MGYRLKKEKFQCFELHVGSILTGNLCNCNSFTEKELKPLQDNNQRQFLMVKLGLRWSDLIGNALKASILHMLHLLPSMFQYQRSRFYFLKYFRVTIQGRQCIKHVQKNPSQADPEPCFRGSGMFLRILGDPNISAHQQ